MKFAVLAALVAIALPAPVSAADWVLVSQSSRDNNYYIDRLSIRTMPNGYKRAWVRAVFASPTSDGYTGEKSLHECDCSEFRKRVIQLTAFKGEEADFTNNSPLEWTYAQPGSVNEEIVNFVCRK